ncbi:MAG: ABC transporter permease [Alphaproteobacteria bacterium]|nr:ABC transporter permease [Alphaproteobacteria bacterium]
MVDRTLDMPPIRPEFIRGRLGKAEAGDVARPLTVVEKVANNNGVRKLSILIALVIVWQLYTVVLDVEPLMFPQFTDTMVALWSSLISGKLVLRIWSSVYVLVQGYAAGLVLATVFTVFAVSTRLGSDLLSTLTSMFNPLPAIALLPLAMLWFGLGNLSLIFVLIHSVLWAVALNTHTGFMAVSDTLRMVGRNYGLTGVRYVALILIPAAFPSILAGLKIGWAFAWRTLIAAELVFGANQGSGGLGWFIFENKNNLETAHVFAGLFTIIVVGVVVENVIFRNIEIRTVQKWGMQR